MQGKQRKLNPPGAPPGSLASLTAPAAPATPAAGWCVGGMCGGSALSAPQSGGDLEPWGVEEGCERQLPAPTPSSSCEWRATWDLSAKG